MNIEDWLGFIAMIIGMVALLAGIFLAIASPLILIVYLIIEAL